MLKWFTLLLVAGLACSHPGVYDEYTYDDEAEEGDGDGDYYLYYDEDESNEPDIDDEELKKIVETIADYSYEENTPQKSHGGNGKKNKVSRPKA